MKNYILALLIVVFSFLTVHDFVIKQSDHDTQAELIFKAGGKLTYEQLCASSKVHDMLHEMVFCFDLFMRVPSPSQILHDTTVFAYHLYIPHHISQTLYRPPIA